MIRITWHETKKYGLAVWTVYVNGTEVAQFLSEAAAATRAMELANKFKGGLQLAA